MSNSKMLFFNIIALVSFVLISIFYYKDVSSVFENINKEASFDDEWHVQTDATDSYFDRLPSFLHTQHIQYALLSKELHDITEGDSLIFFSFQQQIKIFIDGEEAYSFVPDAHFRSKTPGNKWNVFPLSTSYNGKTLTVEIFDCYRQNRVAVPAFYCGTYQEIIMPFTRCQFPSLFLSMVMIFFSFTILLFYFLFKKNAKLSTMLPWMASFAFFKGLWSLIECNAYSLFYGQLLLISQVSYLSLKLAIMSFLIFVNISFHERKNRFLQVMTYISFADFWICWILQLFGIADFAVTVYVTHAILAVSGIYILCGGIYKMIRYKKLNQVTIQRNPNAYFAHIVCIMLIAIATLMDMFYYYYACKPDKAFFSRITDVIYVIVLSFSLLFDFLYLVKTGREADIIKKEAYIDSMTKLKNRTAFEHDIDKIPEKNWRLCSFVILDLNNLKTFNDKHGHDMGDYYIIICSEVIQDYFSKYGSVYRIGGDEFCVIAKDLKEPQFEKIQQEMEHYMTTLHIPTIKLNMSISSGYASFNPVLDQHIRDTRKRADEEMYKHKEELKKQLLF